MLLIIRFIVIVTSLIFISACSIFSSVKTTEQNTYVFNKLPHIQPATKHTHLTLLVKSTSANSIYNTKNMAYISKPYQVAYFVNNRWADRPADMLMPLLIQALQNQGYYQAIVTSAYNSNYDWVLTINLLELQQNFLTHPSTIHLTIQAELLNAKSRKIITSRQFSIIEPTTEMTPYGGVIAANNAVAKLIDNLVLFSQTNN